MPVALRAEEGALSLSSCERSRPRDFLTGALDFLGSAFPPVLASSSFSRASFSAFFWACSAFFAASASLWRSVMSAVPGSETYFFALLLDPFCQFSLSAAASCESLTAAFCAATSAFLAFPATFLVFSEPFLPAMSPADADAEQGADLGGAGRRRRGV